MSPTLALHSPNFLFYSALLAGILFSAGVVLAGLRALLRERVEHAWKAYCGWLVIVPLLALGFFLGREAIIALLTAIAILGFLEFARATELHVDRWLSATVTLAIVAVGIACMTRSLAAFLMLPAFVTPALLAIPVVRNRGDGQLRLVLLAVFGFHYFGWMLGHVMMLANSPHAYAYLGYLLLAVGLNDVSAYISGKLFGRHPLRSNISPKKTWEGALGALAVSLALPWLLRPTMPHFEPMDCIVVGLIVGIGGQMGDLVVSVIKRDVGVKDMGALIPGHGGVLDRIDSLIYVAPLFFHYVHFFHEQGG